MCLSLPAFVLELNNFISKQDPNICALLDGEFFSKPTRQTSQRFGVIWSKEDLLGYFLFVLTTHRLQLYPGASGEALYHPPVARLLTLKGLDRANGRRPRRESAFAMSHRIATPITSFPRLHGASTEAVQRPLCRATGQSSVLTGKQLLSPPSNSACLFNPSRMVYEQLLGVTA